MSERTSKVGGPTRNNEVAVVVADSLANLALASTSIILSRCDRVPRKWLLCYGYVIVSSVLVYPW